MIVSKSGVGLILGFLLVLLAAAPVAAQTTAGAIAGTVRDGSGGVLPGVTVEASSPVLIEKVRSVVTDDTGQYRIIDLRPGTYVVMFSLTGFSAVRREGIVLTTGFTANVSVELGVGSVEETITVTGESPVVDVQNTATQTVMTRDVLDSIPGGRYIQNLGSMIPGVSPTSAAGAVNRDVGGTSGYVQGGLVIHGSKQTDQQQQVDGFPTFNWIAIESGRYGFVDAPFQEYVFDTGSNSSETENAGVRVNMIPREGSNTFRFSLTGNFIPVSWIGENLDEELEARGLTTVNDVKTNHNWTGSLGGPIARDKVWFFASYSQGLIERYNAGSFANSCLTCWEWKPDLTKQTFLAQDLDDVAVRLNWQASPRNKINFFYDRNTIYRITGGSITTGPETQMDLPTNNQFYAVSWTSPVNNKLLLEGGYATTPQAAPGIISPTYVPEGTVLEPAIADSGTGITYRAPGRITDVRIAVNTARGAMSYVTGTHSTRIGALATWGNYTQNITHATGNISYTTNNGNPTGVAYESYPFLQNVGTVLPQLGIFAQDQWTMRKLTVNAGVRYDYYRGYIKEQNNPPTTFTPNPRFVPRVEGPHWHDISPRLGIAYDVRGNGKTALKGSLNRFVNAEGVNSVRYQNPMESNITDTRQWTDNGDHVIQGNPLNKAANLELGPSTNLNFGTPTTNLSLDPDWARGFNVRPANWEWSVGVQQELMPRVSMNAMWTRRDYVNFMAVYNRGTAPTDFDSYCVTTPVDSRMPDGGGRRVCGLYNVKPNKVGVLDLVRTKASNFGEAIEYWHGFDFTMNARPRNILLQGGVSVGRRVMDNCGVMTGHPEVNMWEQNLRAARAGTTTFPLANAASNTLQTSLEFCHAVTDWQPDLKISGSYTLPYDISVAGTLTDAAGIETLASGTYSSALIAPSLGRPLAGAANASISLVEVGDLYTERFRQVDLRFAKTFRVGGGRRVQAQFDMYNALNGNAITGINTAYGNVTTISTTWQRVSSVLQARTYKIGGRFDF